MNEGISDGKGNPDRDKKEKEKSDDEAEILRKKSCNCDYHTIEHVENRYATGTHVRYLQRLLLI